MRFSLVARAICFLCALAGIGLFVGCGAGVARLTQISIAPANQTMPKGTTLQLSATGTYDNGTTQSLDASVMWQTSQSAVATINVHGAVTAVGQGVTQVSAAFEGVTGSTPVTVGQPALLTITVSPSQSSLPLGESEQLTATGSFSDGSTQDLTQSARWSSSVLAIANVSAQGIVTGMGLGVAQLSATLPGVTGSTSVTVGAPALLSITVSPNPSTLPVGESVRLTATGNFSDGSTQNLTQSATWSSSSAIANLGAAGTVVANAAGTTTISATAGSVLGSANLTVTPAVVIALNIIPATVSMVLQSSRQLQAMATMSDGTTQNMTAAVAWSSAQPGIASVTGGGLAMAQQVGSTAIQAQVSGLTGSASLTVIPLMTVSYFNLANAKKSGYDDIVRLTNPGLTLGNLCAMIYVFDTNEELNECCGCAIPDSGLLTLSLIDDLTANTLTGKKPVAGVIEIVPSSPGTNAQCNAGSLAPNGVILGWGTNVQASQGTFQVTEEAFAQTRLSATQVEVLATECSMMQQLGSGRGICSCGTGD